MYLYKYQYHGGDNRMMSLDSLTPKAIVEELDKYIVGQTKAKKAVAIALRNRIRRLKLAPEIREEIAPKNILMMGPTGVGKTEIARRLAKLAGAPFIKVEATKYTEVGYVGRDVESMIRDLMHAGFAMVKAEMSEKLKAEAAMHAEEALLDLILPGMNSSSANVTTPTNIDIVSPSSSLDTREKFRKMLNEGKLDDRLVEIQTSASPKMPAIEFFSSGGMEDLEQSLGSLSGLFSSHGKNKKKSIKVKDAKEILLHDELEKLLDKDVIAEEARQRVQEAGIVFIDEIDKIANREGKAGGVDVSREGVQRDILPIVEGSSVNTKYGTVDTTHILFIASGAFNVSKPQDLIPELQGRFPIRVELEALNANDFERILTEPKNALTKQYSQLLMTEGIDLVFLPDAIKRISEIASDVNTKAENIGARRLHTVLERVLEELSFEASDHSGERIEINADYVNVRFKELVDNQDLMKYIL